MNGAYIRPVANGRSDELTALAQRIADALPIAPHITGQTESVAAADVADGLNN